MQETCGYFIKECSTNMKKDERKRIRYLLLMCGLLLCLSIMPCQYSEAASNKTVRKAYEKFLKRHKTVSISDGDFYNAGFTQRNKGFISSFALCDIDKDKTPELITLSCLNFRWSVIRVYRYKNGKVILYQFKDKKKAEWDNRATANGTYNWYICKKDHIHNIWSGYDEEKSDIYKINRNKKRLDYYLARYTYLPVNFHGYANNGFDNYGEISQKLYEELTKKCKQRKLKYYTNNSSNRKKLLKGTCKISN